MDELQIIVCIKQVPDPESGIDSFTVDSETKKIVPVGVAPYLNPFDENALEAALQIKDERPCKVTVLSVGDKLSQPVLRKAYVAGTDDLILLTDSQFKDLDNYSTAKVLSAAIRKIGKYDLILTGRQSSDWGFGLTGLFIAEILEIPGISLARKVKVKDDKVVAEKVSENGYELVEAPMPALVTVGNEIGEMRYISSVLALRAASKKPIKLLNAEDLGLDSRDLRTREVFDLFMSRNERKCKLIDGSSVEEKAANLVVMIQQDGVI